MKESVLKKKKTAEWKLPLLCDHYSKLGTRLFNYQYFALLSQICALSPRQPVAPYQIPAFHLLPPSLAVCCRYFCFARYTSLCLPSGSPTHCKEKLLKYTGTGRRRALLNMQLELLKGARVWPSSEPPICTQHQGAPDNKQRFAIYCHRFSHTSYLFLQATLIPCKCGSALSCNGPSHSLLGHRTQPGWMLQERFG